MASLQDLGICTPDATDDLIIQIGAKPAADIIGLETIQPRQDFIPGVV